VKDKRNILLSLLIKDFHVLVSVADLKVMAVHSFNKECYEVNILFNSNYMSALQLHILNSQYYIKIYLLDDTDGWTGNTWLYL
jgi:hypothetical protein